MASTNLQVGPQSRVTLSSRNVIRPSCPVRQVVITPLHVPTGTHAGPARNMAQQPIHRTISKLLIREVEKSKGKKDQGKAFTLRDLNTSALQTCTQLKILIKAQLDADIVDEFDIGYIQNNTVVSLRSPQDVQEVWSSIVKGDNVTLWCDGLRGKESPHGKSTKKRSNKSAVDDCDDDEDMEVTKKKKKKKSEERGKGRRYDGTVAINACKNVYSNAV